jgi:hypothetical protein
VEREDTVRIVMIWRGVPCDFSTRKLPDSVRDA